ncbi:protein kinase domain-containing protein [Nocardioides panaciterrulae]|uniref:non-specific serine/threonine protein kinase n=1 Tax=Nocardioides panaciterrulae TaxID=661492 RepID=A0A7Y9JCE3_9ACTN|nr:serine/threonine protein kinase [Nocardioides panaciterrulae]
MTSETGVVADRYELGELLGRGGMADVHRATDRVLQRPVAVKVLRETADEESDRLRFTAEARTLARLSHPGLVMVLDAGTTAERPYLVMELVEGQTLAQCCSGGSLPPDRVAALGAQLADALAYAHGQGVVHRDVKPGNVLIGRADRVKLADFGIARLLGDAVRHTRTGHAIGTAAYLAPEQVQGGEITPAVDVYSLGLVLLEALTGERSFPGTPTESALARLQRAPEVPAWLPPGWRELLQATSALDPAARPTARQVADELAALAAGSTGTRTAPAPADPTRVLPGPPPAPPGRTVLAAPRPAAAPTATTGPAHSGPDRAPLPARARAAAGRVPRHLWGVLGAVAAILVVLVVVALAATGGSSSGRDDLPSNTPARLRQPLQDLHDAVHGGAS